MTTAVELVGVSKSFGGQLAVEPLNLAIEAGSFFCLLGASGSGKSTVLRMLAGLEQVSAGRILLGGRDVTELSPHRRPVNTVFQSYALFPKMTVRENVAYGLRASRTSRAEIERRVLEALAMVRMGDYADRPVPRLSGGQQQRVALARSLVNQPEVLLLDEPLGALDLALRREMQEEMVRLHARTGATFLHVTHDQEEAFACADQLAVMNEGRMHQVGSPEQVYRRPRTGFVARFMGTANLLSARVLGPTAGGYELETAIGRVRAGSWEVWRPDDRVTVVVRPEDIDVADVGEGDEPAHGAAARLRRAAHSSSHVRLSLECATGELVAARSSSPSAALMATPGDAVRVRIDRESAWILPDDGAPGSVVAR